MLRCSLPMESPWLFRPGSRACWPKGLVRRKPCSPGCYSSWAIHRLGYINTLWSSVFWVLIGAFFALLLNKAAFKSNSNGQDTSGKASELLKGLTIVKEEPKVLIGGIVRIFNTTAQFAF